MGVGESTFQTFMLPAPPGRPIPTGSLGGIGWPELRKWGMWAKVSGSFVWFFWVFFWIFFFPPFSISLSIWQQLGSASPDRSRAVFVNSNWVKRCFVSELSSFLSLLSLQKGQLWFEVCWSLPGSCRALQGHTAPYHHQNTSKIHLLWAFITISTRVLHFYQTLCPLKENHTPSW